MPAASSPIVEVDESETRSLLPKAMAPMDTITADESTFLWPTVNNQPKGKVTPEARSFWWPSGNNQPYGIGNPWTSLGQGSPGASQGGISSGPSIQQQQSQQNVGPVTQPQVGAGFYPWYYPGWTGPEPIQHDNRAVAGFPPGFNSPGSPYPGMTNMNDHSAGHGAKIMIGG